jgi:hypothetical protein
MKMRSVKRMLSAQVKSDPNKVLSEDEKEENKQPQIEETK